MCSAAPHSEATLAHCVLGEREGGQEGGEGGREGGEGGREGGEGGREGGEGMNTDNVFVAHGTA